MIAFLKKYKGFGIGLLVTVVLLEILKYGGFISIDPKAVLENLFFFILWWMIISLPIQNLDYFKRHRNIAYKFLALLGLMLIIIAAESYIGIPNNPVTISALILFWLGVMYLLLPNFFNKYRLPILTVYGGILLYFLYSRLGTAYLEERHNQIINLLLIPIPILLVLWIFEQWRWLKTLKAEKGKAELALLKSQINPHFFFNTLNNLYGLSVEKSDKAPEVILKLSDMMRYTIYEGKEDAVSLQEELNYLKNYIELHKIRFQQQVDINFTHSVDDNYKIAPLLFIILLENAFKHGAERLTSGAYIHLDLTAIEGHLSFNIENNFELNDNNAPAGIGLTNLRRRLKLIYPHKHKLNINKDSKIHKATLEIDLK